MRLDLGLEGGWMVDPRNPAARLDVSTDELRRLNRLEAVMNLQPSKSLILLASSSS
jgi:hypothetical protein